MEENAEKPTVLLIDLSALYHVASHAVGENDSITKVQEITLFGVGKAETLARERAGSVLTAICCDDKKNWRKDVASSYKAQREAKPPAFYEQFEIIKDRLRADGHLLWQCEGFEADDVIAVATDAALAAGHKVIIATPDKDLSQLVCDEVLILGTRSWMFVGREEVIKKFGVAPHQVADWLALVGDTSDNIEGCKGVGDKKAAELLTTYGTIPKLYAAAKDAAHIATNPFWRTADGKKPLAIHAALIACEEKVMLARKLTGLSYDAEIKFDDIYKEREIKPIGNRVTPSMDDPGELITSGKSSVPPKTENETSEAPKVSEKPMEKEKPAASPPTVSGGAAPETAAPIEKATTETSASETLGVADGGNDRSTAITRAPEVTAMVVQPDYVRQLEPKTPDGALNFAEVVFNSRLYPKYASREQVFTAMVRGRAFGWGGVEALDMFWPIEINGSKSLSLKAHTRIHLAQSLPDCEYFLPIESTNEKAVYKTRRRSWPEGVSYTHEYTSEDAIQAGLATSLIPRPRDMTMKDGKLVKDDRSHWDKDRKGMLRKTCGSQLVTIVYPGAGLGLVSYEEAGGE